MLGTRVRDVVIEDMAVHQPSGCVYLSVMRGRGPTAVPVIIQVARGGEVSEVDLGNIRHSKLELPNAPAADAKLYSWNSRTFTITDLEFIGGDRGADPGELPLPSALCSASGDEPLRM